MIRVLIIESEISWGQRIDEVVEFQTRDEAEKFCKDYNTKHNPVLPVTPSWYIKV